MKHPVRFAVGFGLLGVCVVMAVAGFVLGLTSLNKATKHSVAVIQTEVSPGGKAAYKAACDGAQQSAAGAGIVLTKCELVKPVKGQKNPDLRGDEARVVLQVRETGGNYFIVETIVSKAAYSVKALQVVAAPAKPVKTLP